MKAIRIVYALILMAPLSGCYHRPAIAVTVLPVPPQNARYPSIVSPLPLPLPLTPTARKDLIDALAKDLNPNADSPATEVVSKGDKGGKSDNGGDYEALLDLLGKDLKFSDLSGTAFKTIFPGPRVDDVKDARDPKSPRDHVPIAWQGKPSQGRYWWIFYRDDNDHVTGLMVVRLPEFSKPVEKDR